MINGICRISPSFSHFATDPEIEKKNIRTLTYFNSPSLFWKLSLSHSRLTPAPFPAFDFKSCLNLPVLRNWETTGPLLLHKPRLSLCPSYSQAGRVWRIMSTPCKAGHFYHGGPELTEISTKLSVNTQRTRSTARALKQAPF